VSINQLSLTNFRGLKSTTLDFHPHLNIITGENGSGKTSLLESINVISQACSFRTHRLKQCISHSHNQLLLFARFQSHKVGLAKSDSRLDIKVNGEIISKRSDLVKKTPTSIINTDSFNLITGAPTGRRNFLDWCLFHVEPEFVVIHGQFKHALKQRNAILKSRSDLNTIDYWDSYLIEPSLIIRDLRKEYANTIGNILKEDLSILLDKMKLSFEYEQGWQQDEELAASLKKSRDRDIKMGFTNLGIHRDNIKIMTNGFPVVQVLSRGQLKRLCIALQIILLGIVKERTNKPLVLLVDDLGSELDISSQKLILNLLLKTGVQLFITNIDKAISLPLSDKEYKRFHVEHGIIKVRKTS
jgi:DNA replication and repair protein RecF